MHSGPENKKYTYIELFGGCGGLSLGLESAGFRRILANEISPMAAETFAYNLVKGARESLPLKAASPATWNSYFTFLEPPNEGRDGVVNEKSFRDWRARTGNGHPISSEAEATAMGRSSSDLIVGDAGKLAVMLKDLKARDPSSFRQRFGNVALLAGGPPCQSFSLAGKRQRDHPRNRLFESFVAIAETVRPKVVMFENVLGITHPFFDEAGVQWHPWHEVCRRFKQARYLPIPALVNAADFGVPQSRLRFIMVAVEEEFAWKVIGTTLDQGGLPEALRRARTAYQMPGDDRDLIFRVEDIEKGLWPSPLFPRPSTLGEIGRVTVASAIEDLRAIDRGLPFAQGKYAKELDKLFKRPRGVSATSPPKNHSLRNHGQRTRARFRLLRVLANDGLWVRSIADVSRRREEVVGRLVGKALLVPACDGAYVERENSSEAEVRELISSLASAKNVQKCLNPNAPAGAQLSIPDDSIHWQADRVLTIREMARIQSFPDWFEFRSKETTGGGARAYEVPQYTQVGNAVPPLLARAFGRAILDFLTKLDPPS
jgi:DNA (cytosine-5)-methyltransferase 1